MNSLALSTANAPALPAKEGAQVRSADAKGAGGLFSTLLTTIGTVPTGALVPAPGAAPVVVAPSEAASSAEGEQLRSQIPGIALPAGTASGKNLPLGPAITRPLAATPVDGGHDTQEPDETGTVVKAKVDTDTIQIPKAAPRPLAIMLPAVPAPLEIVDGTEPVGKAATGEEPRKAADVTLDQQVLAAQPTLPAAMPVASPALVAAPLRGSAPEPLRLAVRPQATKHSGSQAVISVDTPISQAPAQLVARQPEAAQHANAIAVHVAPEAEAKQVVTAPQARIGDAKGDAPVPSGPKAAVHTAEAALARPAGDAAPMAQQPTPAFAQQPTEQAASPIHAPAPHRAQPADALRDLTQVVDRLVAAREAFVPAAAALAVEHSEFGDLSLRFNHHRDGRLDVQIAAADPASHRAIAAAVQQQGASTSGDNSAANAQTSSHTPSQSRARDAAGERDGGNGNGAPARDGQPETRRQAPRGKHEATGGRPHGGVFA